MRTRVIHLINPKTDSLTTRPLYLNRALYSPLAGLLAVAAVIPRDQYEVVLTDENIETIDFDLDCDMVGISAMTSYVNRGYEIADHFRAKGVPVVMGGVHPSFMPQEALKHADAVVIGEVELVIDKLLDDLEQGSLRGTYKSDKLHPMVGVPMPRYDLLEEAPLREQDLRADLARLPPGLHLLRRAADERAQIPLPAGRRGDQRDGELRRAHHLDQRRRLFRHAGASQGSHARAQGPRHPVAGRRHLKTRAGRPHARTRRRKRLHAAEHRLRVDLARHAQERAQARQPAGDLRRAGGEGALLRHHGVRPVHVRLRRRRHLGVRRHRRFQHRRRLRRLRLFDADALPRHADLVRDEEGKPHRFLRLDDVRPGPRGLPAGADVGRRTAHRPKPRLRKFLFEILDRQPLPAARQAGIARNG